MSDLKTNRLLKGLPRHLTHGFSQMLFSVLLCLATTACGKDLPNPVERKDGVARIPIDGLVFVIPEKTWLKGYHRNKTDGLVHGFDLHAFAPTVEPWSPDKDERMYKVPGWGARIEIAVTSNDGRPLRKITEKLYEETDRCHFTPSPKHNDPRIRYCQTDSEKIYGYVDGDHFHYRLHCESDARKAREKFPTDPHCTLYFRHKDKLLVEVVVAERYFQHAFDIGRKVEAQLLQFEQTHSAH